MSIEEWQALQIEAEEDSIEFDIEDVLKSDFSNIPEEIQLHVIDDYFPESTIRREGDNLLCEITEHIYSKYWWHKFSAGAFSHAMMRAVTRLSSEGHPLRKPSIESDDDIHIFVRWELVLPISMPSDQIVDSIKSAFDLVWQRADSILENRLLNLVSKNSG